MGAECWWNDTDRGKQKYWERNVIQRGWEVNEWVWNDTDRGKQKYWERNVIQCGWEVNEWGWSIGGMIVTGEN